MMETQFEDVLNQGSGGDCGEEGRLESFQQVVSARPHNQLDVGKEGQGP